MVMIAIKGGIVIFSCSKDPEKEMYTCYKCFTCVTKTVANLTTYKRKPGDLQWHHYF